VKESIVELKRSIEETESITEFITDSIVGVGFGDTGSDCPITDLATIDQTTNFIIESIF